MEHVSVRDFEPAYQGMHRTGELKRRVCAAVEGLASCRACPRNCRVDRLAGKMAVCKTGRWVGSFDEDAVRRIIGDPPAHRPVAMLPIGYAAKSPRNLPRRSGWRKFI